MIELDAIILGAGPAGLSAALRLTALGHRIAVVTPPPSRSKRQLETVPRLEVITHAFPGFSLDTPALVNPSCAGISWWTGQGIATREVSVIDRGSITSPALDSQLLSHCMRSGVNIVQMDRGAAKIAFDHVWHLTSPNVCLRSHFLIDATGRHSSLRRRTRLTPWRQAVITGELRLKAGTPALWTESLPDAWLWAIRDHADHWLVSLFVDTASMKEGRSHIWQRSLAQSRLAKLIESSASSALAIQESSPVTAPTVFKGGLLHIGDALLARCPLASQGLSAAISDGQSAAVALHNLLTAANPESVVSDFLESKHRHARQRHVKFLASSYASAPYDTAYWKNRSSKTNIESPTVAELPDMDQPLVLSSSWRLRPHPTLEGDSIRLAPCLCSDDETMRWLAGHPIAELLAPLFTCVSSTPRSLMQNWSSNRLVADQMALPVLHWLSQRGVLIPSSHLPPVISSLQRHQYHAKIQ